MMRILARWRAKRNYVWKLLLEGETSDINAALDPERAAKRELSKQLTAEAEEIEGNIKKVDVQLDRATGSARRGSNAHFVRLFKEGPQPANCGDLM